jgi:hypothetical protein
MKRSKLVIGLIAATAWPLVALAQPSAAGEKHNLSLTQAQQSEIWRALGKSAGKTQLPAGLNVGEAVPDTMNVLHFNRRLQQKIRAIGSYRYALLHSQVLIVDPATKQIVSIIGP